MTHQKIDTNIGYFSRSLDKIRRSVALFCISLIIIATLPFFIPKLSAGWDLPSILQGLGIIMFCGLFIQIYHQGYTTRSGLVIFTADVGLLCLGIFRPDTDPIIAMFFFTPALIAYLFFKPKLALPVTIVSYIVLNYLFFNHFYSFSHPSATYILLTIIFAGIALLVGLHLVVSLRHNIEQELIQIAHSDALTGLPNRMHFESRMQQEIERCRMDMTPLCLALVDLDHFKQVNDNYGHDCGDEMLIHVANHLRMHVRAQDIICRFGGEEIMIIMPNTAIKSAIPILERVRRELQDADLIWKNHSLNITASIGCAELDSIHFCYESLFKEADENLYAAKMNGRNQIYSKLSA